MADERILVEIVLDDGSIQKGFIKAEKQAKDSAGKIKDSFGTRISDEFSSIGDRAAGIFGGLSKGLTLSLGAAAAGAFAFKKALDFTLEGEKLIAIEKQFSFLAEREKISADVLLAGLERSANGLVDVGDLLQASNKAIVNLGQSAERLPEILDVARKSSILLGRDTKGVFEDLLTGIENGNAKAIKNAGIIVDTEKVYRDFARTIGLLPGELSQAQRQAVLLDAVIEKGQKTFKGLEGEATPLANAITRLGVAINDASENASKGFSKNITASLAESVNAVTQLFTGVDSTPLQDKISKVEKRISSLKEQAASTKELLDSSAKESGFVQSTINFLKGADTAAGSLARTNVKIQEQEELLARLKAQSDTTASAEVSNSGKIGAAAYKLTAEQIALINQRKNSLDQFILSQENAEIQSKQKLLSFETDYEAKRALSKEIANERLRLLDADFNNKILEVNKQFSAANGFNEEQREQARLAIQKNFAAQRTSLEIETNEEFVKRANDTKERLRVIQAGLNAIFAQGAVKLAESLQKGGNSFENFAQGILGIIADQVINLGQALIIQGLAIETFVASINSLLPGSGAAAAAAGLGLVLFGTALKSAVGGGGSSGASTAGGGVAVGGGSDITSPVGESPVSSFEPAGPKTNIAVNIQGDVLDSQESSLRIVDLLNSAFDQQGVTVTG